ncbi:MAG: CapA family protein [Peptococcaceae bacterium]|jgi:poly-gamma-glutamate synthesis protein (capsule biosynthesis protein)|nr:CapA family protein [Peptococcaceae bacterium]MDH7524178.1 CapA family protein [Peptococcaceae bacterium]
MKKLYKLPVFVFLALCLAGCGTDASATAVPSPVPAETVLAVPPPDELIVITATGDIMMHNTQIKAGYRPADGSYDFSSFFEYVSPLLRASDLVIGNLETPLAGKKAGYSGFPRFNSPEALAENLKRTGFHVVTTANNHCLDKGDSGLASTLDFLDREGLLHTGTARSQEEHNKILVVERKGIKIAVLAYTFGTNGILPDKSRPFSVNYLEAEKVILDIGRAKSEGAQLVITCLHYGVEYQTHPNAEQINLAAAFLEAGADVVLGHHPHVLQPPAVVRSMQTGEEKNKFAAYSLGNFISDQRGLERESSIILNLYFGIDPLTRKPYFKKAAYIPIKTRRFRQNGSLCFQVLPIEAALTSIKTKRASGFTRRDEIELEGAWAYVTNHLNTQDPLLSLQPLPIPLQGLQIISKWQQ